VVVGDYPFERQSPEILYLDIETSLSEMYNFGLKVPGEYVQPSRIVHEFYIICWAASWLGSDRIISQCVTHEDALEWTDKNILERLWKLIDRADIISGHNIDRFDFPRINTRFVLNGFDKLESKTIDTLKIARRMKFESNTLSFLCHAFGIGCKDKMEEADWLKIANDGDPASLRKMNRYCRKDVINGKALLERMVDWSGKRIEQYAHKFPKEPNDIR
jgi:DNA polymerase III alpha subunit (gram-positive type)